MSCYIVFFVHESHKLKEKIGMGKKKKKNRYTWFRTKIIDAFDFSKVEQRGIIVLLILLLILFFIRFAVVYLHKSKQPDEMDMADLEIFLQQQQHHRDSILSTKKWKNTSKNNYYNTKQSFKKKTLNPFPFDPNTLPFSGWVKLGFTEKQAQQILNYNSKGGYFHEKTDLKKMYSITDEDYQVLENYIYITRKEKTKKEEKPLLYSFQKVEINTADSFGLQKIRGIGPKTASQIIKYREKLGGYVAVNQLLEIHIIDSVRFLKISPYLQIDTASVRKININNASIKDLIHHPYIDYYLAKSIVVYRQKHGNYADVCEIKKAVRIYEELYLKITPYLMVD
ncbi:MAG: helix-hairpin-helix domain-containing protein [Lentimicrobiaceae bacterium]|nr:helix-hairpin-helix domain-containing protein [Lentimicrobiaceae bacterium]